MFPIFKKSNVSSTNILNDDAILLDKSFMLMGNKRGPKTDPCGTPAVILRQNEVFRLKQLFFDALFSNFLIILKATLYSKRL